MSPGPKQGPPSDGRHLATEGATPCEGCLTDDSSRIVGGSQSSISPSIPLAYPSCFKSAVSWLDFGVPVVPCQPRSKILIEGYGAHSRHIETLDDARYWFFDRRCNVGLVCGVPLAVLDFDDLDVYNTWAARFPQLARTLTTITARGRHCYFLTDRALPSAKLENGIELKATGSVVVAVPSIHPGGHVYSWLDDSAPLLELPADAPFLSSLRKEENAPVTAQPPVIEGSDTVARIKRAWPIIEIAQQLTRLRATAGQDRWLHGRCPFHKEDHPSFWIDTARGTFGCRSCGVTGDTINLFALWRGVDVQTAIKQMAEARNVHAS